MKKTKILEFIPKIKVEFLKAERIYTKTANLIITILKIVSRKISEKYRIQHSPNDLKNIGVNIHTHTKI